MKNQRINFFTLLLVNVFLFTGCDENEKNVNSEFRSGVVVVNEGNFTDADGTISFFNPENETVTLDLFGLVNNDRALGDVVQSMTIAGDEAYIIVNNSNKVEIVDANTFEAIHTLSDVSLPRYFATANGKGYLTEWVSFVAVGRVSVIDLATHEVLNTITTDFGAENIIATSNKIFVSNNFSNTVSVIDPSTDEVIETIEVGSSPGEFVVDSENNLWVICGGDYEANNGTLVQLNPVSEVVIKTIELSINPSVKLAIDEAKTSLFYYNDNIVYKTAISAVEEAEPFITQASNVSFYGIDIDSETDIIYLADSKGFLGNGTVYRYNTDGSFIDTFNAGRGPNGFLFK